MSVWPFGSNIARPTARAPDYTVCSMANLDSGRKGYWQVMSIDGALQRGLQSQVEANITQARAGKPRHRQKLSRLKTI